MLLQLERPLDKEVNLSIFAHFNHVLQNEKKIT
jgi:hypothetical protein